MEPLVISYYIDEKGRIIYEAHGMKSEVTGFDNEGGFTIKLLWEFE